MGKNITKLMSHVYEKEISIQEYRIIGDFFNTIGIPHYNMKQLFAALAILRFGPWCWGKC